MREEMKKNSPTGDVWLVFENELTGWPKASHVE